MTDVPAAEHRFTRQPHLTLAVLSAQVLVSMVAEPITGLVDTAFVARLGAPPLAALGIGTTLLSGILWIFNFLGVGAQTEVARRSGRNDSAAVRRVAMLAVLLGAGLGTFVAALLLPMAGAVASAMGGTGAVHADAHTYLVIRLLGIPAVVVMLTCFGALRGLQDMRTPLLIAVGSNAMNILLDALLIFGAGPVPALGVAGAAWASVISQWVGAAAGVGAIVVRIGLTRTVTWRDAHTLLVVGGNLFLRTALLFAFLIFATRVATRVSTEAAAAHQALRQIWFFTALALDAISASAQSLVGYFLGAGLIEQARRVAAVSFCLALAIGGGLALIMAASTPAVEAFLVPPSAHEVYQVAWWLCVLSQPISAIAFITDGIHWGTRDYRYLRNAMLVASGVGLAALAVLDLGGSATLAAVWIATTVWVGLRGGLGLLRVWPGIGNAPLRLA